VPRQGTLSAYPIDGHFNDWVDGAYVSYDGINQCYMKRVDDSARAPTGVPR